jgi:hypothetical protein
LCWQAVVTTYSPAAASVSSPKPISGGFKEIVYATQRGTIGQLLADPSAIRRGWVMPREGKEREALANSVAVADINGDGVNEIIVRAVGLGWWRASMRMPCWFGRAGVGYLCVR